MKPFTLKCNKCGSEDVLLLADDDRTVSLVCNGPDCLNRCTEYELDEE